VTIQPGAGYQEDPALPGYWFYEGLRIQANLEVHQFVVDYARRALPPGAEILDLAAGEGALTKQLLDAGFRPSCTSWNDKLRVDAPSYRVDLDVDFGAEDVGNRRYPLVCAIEIIEHIENPAALLRSCASVLAPGGRLIVSTPNVEYAPARLQWLVRGCPSTFDTEEVRTNRHIAILWRQGLEYLVERAGYRVVEKHLLGAYHLRPSLASWLKRAFYALLDRFAQGETEGAARLYVLEHTGTSPRTGGPEEVF
jgi:SAM-dependent methyltransferase